eukprot:SAG31_NODE_5183_length_2694_cov_6.997494_2_plen_99_part_00
MKIKKPARPPAQGQCNTDATLRAGGKYQRGGGSWGPGHAMNGGDCYRRSDRSAQYHCKPSFRLKFSKQFPLNAALETMFRFPADKQSCNSVPKFVLNV